MNEDERDLLLTQLIEQPKNHERLMAQSNLTETGRRELSALVATADDLWLAAQGAPPLDRDPIAAMLGLIPDEACQLDSRLMAVARKRARLGVSEVAARLQDRGWSFDRNDVFRWENRTAADVPPAVVEALAAIFECPTDELLATSVPSKLPSLYDSVRTDPRFIQLAARWAQAQRVSLARAVAALDSRMLASVHRGGEPDAEQLLHSLDVLVTSIEHSTPTKD